jgi:hypothetical protein
MKRDLYLDKFIRLLEATAGRAHKDLERERKRIDFLEGKVERLELIVMAGKSDAGREYAERTDRAGEPRKPPISRVQVSEVHTKPSFSEVRDKWNSMTAAEQEEAVNKGNLTIEGKERPV